MQRLKFDIKVWWPDGDYDRQEAVRQINQALAESSGEDPNFLGSLFVDTVGRLMHHGAVAATFRNTTDQKEYERLQRTITTGYVSGGKVTEEYDDAEYGTLQFETACLMTEAADLHSQVVIKDKSFLESHVEGLEHRIRMIKEKLNDTK